jgi:hypothetical protein
LKDAPELSKVQALVTDAPQFGQFPKLILGAVPQKELIRQLNPASLGRQLHLMLTAGAFGQGAVHIQQLEEVLFRIQALELGQETDFIAALPRRKILEEPATIVIEDAPASVLVRSKRAGAIAFGISDQPKSIH